MDKSTDRQERQFFDIPLACDLMRKSSAQVLQQCAAFDARLLIGDDLDSYLVDEDYGPFDAIIVHFPCNFRLRDYEAFSAVTIRFTENKAVECVISLGKPANFKRYKSELEVTKKVLLSLEESYHNGRIQEEDELGTKVHQWKKDNRTEVSFVSRTPSFSPTDTGAFLSVQIRDTQLHPQGREMELLYLEARKRVEDLGYVELHRKDEPIEKVYERRGARFHLTTFLFILAIVLGIGGIKSLVSKDFAFGIMLIIFAALSASLMSKLHNKALRDYRQKKK